MCYAEMDKRKLLLPDLLGKPLGFTDDKGEMIFPKGTKFPKEHYIFFYEAKAWKEIMEVMGE